MKKVSLNFLSLFFLAAVAFSLTFFTACNDTPRENAEEAMEDMHNDMDAQFTMEQEDYRNRVAEWNDRIEREIDEIQAKMENADDAAKAEYQEQIQRLRDWKKDLDSYARDFNNSVERGWDNFRNDLDRTFDRLENDYDGWDS